MNYISKEKNTNWLKNLRGNKNTAHLSVYIQFWKGINVDLSVFDLPTKKRKRKKEIQNTEDIFELFTVFVYIFQLKLSQPCIIICIFIYIVRVLTIIFFSIHRISVCTALNKCILKIYVFKNKWIYWNCANIEKTHQTSETVLNAKSAYFIYFWILIFHSVRPF